MNYKFLILSLSLLFTFLVFTLIYFFYEPQTELSFLDIKSKILNAFSEGTINPIRTQYNGNYEVKIATGNESLYDVAFEKKQVINHSYLITEDEFGKPLEEKDYINVTVNRTDTIICLEAGWDEKEIVTYKDMNQTIVDKNYTYSVPSTLSFYKTDSLSKQSDLTKTKTDTGSLTSSSNPNKFCYQANPELDYYLKFGDNSVIVIQGKDIVGDSLLTNVTAESGDSNFTHLNISITAPYDNLTGYWSFDGDNVNSKLNKSYDFSKENNDGTMYADAVVNSTDCIYGDCLQLDGDGDYIDAGSDSSLDVLSGGFTVSLWIYPKSDFDSSVWNRIIHRNVDDTDNTYQIGGGNIPNGNDFYVAVHDGGTLYRKATTDAVTANQWYHVVATYVSGNLPLLYLNGIEQTGSVTSAVDDGDPAGLQIGRRSDGTGYFNGTIDEVMIFNTSLTATQITDIYNNQSARFVTTGTQDLVNQSYLNISSGNNRVNVSTNVENNFGSNISLFVGYYDGGWSSTAKQNITSNANYTFTISGTSTNLTLNYTFIPGNTTATFYTPIIKGNIYYEAWNEAVGDTTDPVVNLIAPSDSSTVAYSNVSFNATITDDVNISNVTLYVWNSTDDEIDKISVDVTATTSYAANTTVNLTLAGTYTWNYYACDNSSNCAWNNTNYTVTYSVVDTIYPIFNSFTIEPANNTEFVSDAVYNFNATVISTNGTVGFQFNHTNYTASNVTAEVYNVTLTNLARGIYAGSDGYFWWGFGNGTSNNFNASGSRGYEVAQNISFALNLTQAPSGTWTETYDENVAINVTGIQCPSQLTCVLNRNDTGTVNNAVNVSLGARNYNFTYNTSGNANYSLGTTSNILTINQNISWYLNITLSPSNSEVYGTSTTATGIGCPSELTCGLFRNGASVSDPETDVLGVATWTYIFNTSGNTNYSTNSTSANLEITQATPVLTFLINSGTSNITVTYPQDINASAKADNGTVGLDRAGVDILSENHKNISLAVGTYEYRANITGDANYSDVDYTYYNVTIYKNNTNCDVGFNETSPLTYSQSFEVYTNCSSAFMLYRNGTFISNNSAQLLGVGYYNFTVIRNDTANYTYISDEKNFTINKGSSVVYTYLNHSKSNITISVNKNIWLNASLNTGDSGSTIKLYNNEAVINSGTSSLANLTDFNSTGIFNITTSYGATENYTSSYETWWVNVTPVDTTNPDINITFPLNNTNSSNTGLHINYTYSDVNTQTCWWTKDASVTNTTLANCDTNITGQTWSEGENTITVYINDTVNNLNSSTITFTIDTIAPAINISYPLNNTNTTNTGIHVNYTASDGGTGLDSCWWTEDEAVTNTTLTDCTTNLTSEIWTEGLNDITVYTNDTVNNVNSSTITFRLDTNPPTFSNLANQTNLANTSFSFDVNAADTGVGLGYFTLNHTLNFSIVDTTGVITNATALPVAEIYWFNISVNDTLGNTVYNVFYINVTSVIINLTLSVQVPINTTYDSSEINLNVTAINGTAIDKYWYSLDTESNIIFTPNITIKNIGWEAWHELQIWVNDTSGNSDTIIRRFYIGIEENFWIWFDLLIIFFIFLVMGVYWRNYTFIFSGGCLILLMGIWVFTEGITIYDVSNWWVYPFAWILTGIGIILTITSGIEMLEQYGG